MEDWAASVSQQAWSRPLTQHKEKLLQPLELGEGEDTPSCWSCLKKRRRRYFKIKPG